MNGTIEIWDPLSGHQERTVRVGDGVVFPLGVSLDERRVFVWEVEERRASLWNFETNEREAIFADYQGESLRGDHYSGGVAFSPDGRSLAYPATNYQVKLWNIDERRERFMLKAHKWVLFPPRFSPDGTLLATSSWDSEVKLWDNVETGKQSVPTLRGHLAGPDTLVFSSHGRTLITSSSTDGLAQFWHVATGKQVLTLDNVEQVHLSPDDNVLAWRQSNTFYTLRLPPLTEIDTASRPGR
jgi:WD40 repeat protein